MYLMNQYSCVQKGYKRLFFPHKNVTILYFFHCAFLQPFSSTVSPMLVLREIQWLFIRRWSDNQSWAGVEMFSRFASMCFFSNNIFAHNFHTPGFISLPGVCCCIFCFLNCLISKLSLMRKGGQASEALQKWNPAVMQWRLREGRYPSWLLSFPDSRHLFIGLLFPALTWRAGNQRCWTWSEGSLWFCRIRIQQSFHLDPDLNLHLHLGPRPSSLIPHLSPHLPSLIFSLIPHFSSLTATP